MGPVYQNSDDFNMYCRLMFVVSRASGFSTRNVLKVIHNFEYPAGVVIGVLVQYGFPSSDQKQFVLSRRRGESCSRHDILEIGKSVIVSSWNADSGDGDSFVCSVVGKAFQDQQGNYIRQTVSFTKQTSSLDG